MWFIFLLLLFYCLYFLILFLCFFFPCFSFLLFFLFYIFSCPHILTSSQLVFPYFFPQPFSSKAAHWGHFAFFSSLLLPQLSAHPWGALWSQRSSTAPTNRHHSKHASCSLRGSRGGKKDLSSVGACVIAVRTTERESSQKPERTKQVRALTSEYRYTLHLCIALITNNTPHSLYPESCFQHHWCCVLCLGGDVAVAQEIAALGIRGKADVQSLWGRAALEMVAVCYRSPLFPCF